MHLVKENRLTRTDLNDSKLEDISRDIRLYNLLKGALLRKNEVEYADNPYYFMYGSIAYFFTGVAGNGKKTLVEAFAGSAQRCGYEVYRISAVDLFGDTQEETFSEISEFLDDLEIMLKNEDNKYFIIFEDLWLFQDDTKAGRLLFSRLYTLMGKRGANLITASAYDCSSGRFPDLFRGRCAYVIPVKIPDFDRRKKYIISCVGEFFCPQNGVTAEFIAEESDGFTFGELDMLCRELLLYAKGSALDDTDEEAALLSDTIMTSKENPNILSTEIVTEFVEDILCSRYIGAEYGVRKSVCNYPKAVAMAGVPAMAVSASAVGNTAAAETPQSNVSVEDRLSKYQEEAENIDLDKAFDENNTLFDPEIAAMM